MSTRSDRQVPGEPTPDRTEELVRRALREHTDQVEIRPDAYARLAERVVTAQRSRGRLPTWFPPVRIAIAATAAVAVIAAGVVALGGDGGQDVARIETPAADPAGGSPTAPAATGPVEAGTAQGATSAPAGSDAPADPGAGLGPVRATRIAAAEAFLALLDVEPARAVEVGDVVVVRTTAEGSSDADRDIATLDLVEVSGDEVSGWAVAGASGTSVVIDSPGATVLTGPSISVTGSGHGFEATLDVEARSTVDGSLLFVGSTSAGNFGVLEPFTTSVELAGWDRAWIVVRSAAGADGVASSFAAVPVTVAGPAEDATYVVTGVALDDADGGLNLRSAPGAGSERIAVLEWGRPVVRTPGAYPVGVGEGVWWPVTTDGVEGWVNARFLARTGEISAEELTTGAQAFLFALADPTLGGRWAPISGRAGLVVAAEGIVATVAPGGLSEPSGWTDPVVRDASLVELAQVPALLRAEAVIAPFGPGSAGDGPQDPGVDELADRVFAGLPGATVDYTGSDGQPHTLHLFFEQAPIGPRIIGAIFDTGR